MAVNRNVIWVKYRTPYCAWPRCTWEKISCHGFSEILSFSHQKKAHKLIIGMSIELFNKINAFATVPVQRGPIFGGWILLTNLLVTFARVHMYTKNLYAHPRNLSKTTLKIWSKLVKSLKRYPFSKSEKAHSEKNWFKSWNTEWNIVVIITLHLSHSFHPNSSFPSLLSHKFHTRCPQPSPGPFLYHSTAAASPVGTNFWNWMEYRDRNRCEIERCYFPLLWQPIIFYLWNNEL